MESTHLTIEDINFLLESLSYSKKAFTDYTHHDYEIKKGQLKKVEDMEMKLRAIKKGM